MYPVFFFLNLCILFTSVVNLFCWQDVGYYYLDAFE